MTEETTPPTKTAAQLSSAQRIALLGIGGAGMRALARLLAEALGKQVVGTDARYEEIKADPELAQYELLSEETMLKRLAKSDLVVYSEGLVASHPLRQQLAEQGLPAMTLYEALGAVAHEYTTVAVAGTHGKSSTTALLAHILITTGFDPTVFVGANIPAWNNASSRVGQSELLVAEADEYRNHFLSLWPRYLIVTSLDHDHPDFFATFADVLALFEQLLRQMPKEGVAVVPLALYEQHADLPWPESVVKVEWPAEKLELVLPGEHMQHNAWLAIAMAEQLGVTRDAAQEALKSFAGLSRRFEHLGELAGAAVYSDYGHHPHEIAATLAATREKFPDQRILAVIEPHTEERFEEFFDGFVTALQSEPDGLVLVPIYRARADLRSTAPADAKAKAGKSAGKPAGKPSSEELGAALRKKREEVTVLDQMSHLATELPRLAADYDVVIAFSAGELDARLRALVES